MIQIRRVFTHLEEIRHEFGPEAEVPLLRGAIGAVLTNPYAGRYEPDILPMMEALQDVGLDMAQRLLKAMGVPAERIETYGKGAVVGAAGELEHGALWHVPGGYAMRELLGWKGDRDAYAKGLAEVKTGQPGNALSIVPSTKKVGAPGTALDVPLTSPTDTSGSSRGLARGGTKNYVIMVEFNELVGLEMHKIHLKN